MKRINNIVRTLACGAVAISGNAMAQGAASYPVHPVHLLFGRNF